MMEQLTNKPKLVLFDVGGVLLEYRNVFKTAAKDLGLAVEMLYDTFDKYDADITVGKLLRKNF